MRTPEQTREARKDEELRSLSSENEKLKEKIKVMKGAVRDMTLVVAELMPSHRAKIVAMASEIDVE